MAGVQSRCHARRPATPRSSFAPNSYSLGMARRAAIRDSRVGRAQGVAAPRVSRLYVNQQHRHGEKWSRWSRVHHRRRRARPGPGQFRNLPSAKVAYRSRTRLVPLFGLDSSSTRAAMRGD
jgi:hypothetical protein